MGSAVKADPDSGGRSTSGGHRSYDHHYHDLLIVLFYLFDKSTIFKKNNS